jgi:hypothetical protein
VGKAVSYFNAGNECGTVYPAPASEASLVQRISPKTACAPDGAQSYGRGWMEGAALKKRLFQIYELQNRHECYVHKPFNDIFFVAAIQTERNTKPSICIAGRSIKRAAPFNLRTFFLLLFKNDGAYIRF